MWTSRPWKCSGVYTIPCLFVSLIQNLKTYIIRLNFLSETRSPLCCCFSPSSPALNESLYIGLIYIYCTIALVFPSLISKLNGVCDLYRSDHRLRWLLQGNGLHRFRTPKQWYEYHPTNVQRQPSAHLHLHRHRTHHAKKAGPRRAQSYFRCRYRKAQSLEGIVSCHACAFLCFGCCLWSEIAIRRHPCRCEAHKRNNSKQRRCIISSRQGHKASNTRGISGKHVQVKTITGEKTGNMPTRSIMGWCALPTLFNNKPPNKRKEQNPRGKKKNAPWSFVVDSIALGLVYFSARDFWACNHVHQWVGLPHFCHLHMACCSACIGIELDRRLEDRVQVQERAKRDVTVVHKLERASSRL